MRVRLSALSSVCVQHQGGVWCLQEQEKKGGKSAGKGGRTAPILQTGERRGGESK